MEQYSYGVLIGRFQPTHKGHLELIKEGLKSAKQLIIIVGSAYGSRNIKNPWTFDERKEMISACLTVEELQRTHIVPARDYHYTENTWVTQIQQIVASIVGDDEDICSIGVYKDHSSYYMKYFPQWEPLIVKIASNIDATTVRDLMFDKLTGEFEYESLLPPQVTKWVQANFLTSEADNNLCSEYQMLQEYRNAWENSPFPPTFNCVDAVVIKSGHILMITRKGNPGKGLIALPGGFIKETETLRTAVVRELKEETRIAVDKIVLDNHIVKSRTFDYPGRSLRGRMITQAYLIDLGSGSLPKVRGGDDASHAFWLSLSEVKKREEDVFEDHAHIIDALVFDL